MELQCVYAFSVLAICGQVPKQRLDPREITQAAGPLPWCSSPTSRRTCTPQLFTLIMTSAISSRRRRCPPSNAYQVRASVSEAGYQLKIERLLVQILVGQILGETVAFTHLSWGGGLSA